MHVEAPSSSENVPSSHGEQLADPATTANVPAPHRVHCAALASEYRPGLRFRVQGSGFRVLFSGLRFWGVGTRGADGAGRRPITRECSLLAWGADCRPGGGKRPRQTLRTDPRPGGPCCAGGRAPRAGNLVAVEPPGAVSASGAGEGCVILVAVQPRIDGARVGARGIVRIWRRALLTPPGPQHLCAVIQRAAPPVAAPTVLSAVVCCD